MNTLSRTLIICAAIIALVALLVICNCGRNAAWPQEQRDRIRALCGVAYRSEVPDPVVRAQFCACYPRELEHRLPWRIFKELLGKPTTPEMSRGLAGTEVACWAELGKGEAAL